MAGHRRIRENSRRAVEDKESGPVSLKVASKDQTTEVFIMKSWKKVVGAVCMTTLVAAAVAGCGKSGGKSGGGDTIKVGALFELTGNVANYGTSTLNGFKMAVDEVNAKGGVNGKKIEVVQADNKSEPSESGNAATKLVTQDKVVAVVGPATSGSVAAAEPILTANKTPLIAPCATAPAITLVRTARPNPMSSVPASLTRTKARSWLNLRQRI